MNRLEILKKIKKLNKIRNMVETAKYEAIKKLTNSTNVSNHHYALLIKAKHYLKYASKFVNFKNSPNNSTKSKLFIYLSLFSNLIKISYDRENKILEDNIDVALDKLIVVGEPAIKFAQGKQYDIFDTYKELSSSLESIIAIIVTAINQKEYSQIHIVARTHVLKNKILTIYPYEYSKEKVNLNKKIFFPSINNTYQNIVISYVQNVLGGIYQEVYIQFYREKLYKHKTSLDFLDDKLEALQQNLNKLNRKNEDKHLLYSKNSNKEDVG